jgi:hypothetical protein
MGGQVAMFDAAAQVNLIYNEYRKMALNKKYYGARLQRFKLYDLIMEYLIAAGATGSGIAGWALWKSDYGGLVWALISGVSISLAIAKPLLKIADKIENYSKLYGEYTSAFLSLKMLVDDLQIHRAISEEAVRSFEQIRKRAVELARLEDPAPRQEFVRTLQKEVIAEISVEKLWFPKAAAQVGS